MPGIAMSSTRQSVRSSASELRNASADANARAAKPRCRSSSGSDSRTDTSSSTTDTRRTGCATSSSRIRSLRARPKAPCSQSRWRRTNDAELRSHVHQLGQRSRLHLSHRAAAMCLDRDLADVELAAHLLVEQPGNDKRHDLSFTATEAGVPITERSQFGFLTECRPAALNGASDGFEQRVVAYRLGQEFHRSRFHGLHGHRYVSIARNEDDGHVIPVALDSLLDVHSAEVRQMDVQHQATGCELLRAVEELPRGLERLSAPTGESDERSKRFANGDVVV